MTKHAPKKRRLSRGWIRATAWLAGGVTFLGGLGALAAAPKPAQTLKADGPQKRPVVIVRKITRRVIITDPVVSAPVQFVSGSSSSSSSSSSNPAPPPSTSSGGS
jgi:hypothetical protein